MMEEIYGRIDRLARETVEKCAENKLKISAAESCTGGMISSAVTSVPGSSAVIELGICSYSNRIKAEVLGVSKETLDTFSEYSIPCAEEMAEGALRISGADFAVSTSGVAGPSGGTQHDPVGTVYICVGGRAGSTAQRFVFGGGGREYIRAAAAEKALEMLLDKIKGYIAH